jgi:hypothetical protein
MNRTLTFLLMLLLVAGAPSLTSCAFDTEEETLHITGTVVFVPLEGGFLGLIDEEGHQYDPVNLPEEFHEDGLPVEVKASVLLGTVSFRQWGQAIVIEEISRR